MKKVSARRTIALAIIIGAVAVGAIVASGQIGKKSAVSGVALNRDRGAAPSVAVTQPDSGRKPLAYYTGGVRKDLFTAPEPPKPKAEVKPEPKKEPLPAPTPPPVVVNPFADYAYAGTVNLGGRTLALVENSKTKEGQYLAEGDSFMGGKITSIGDRMLTIDVAGKPEMIAKRDDFKLTPLDKSAPFLAAAPAGAPGAPGHPGPGAPGAAGQPQMGPGGPGGGWMRGMNGLPPNIQERIRQRMENMSPEERQRAEERMNRWRDRQFEGGGRRGGGGGGGEGRRQRRNDNG